MEEEVAEQFSEIAVKRGLEADHQWPWSFKTLRGDVDAIAARDSAQGGSGYNPLWNVRDRLLISQLRALRSTHTRMQLKRPPKKDETDG